MCAIFLYLYCSAVSSFSLSIGFLAHLVHIPPVLPLACMMTAVSSQARMRFPSKSLFFAPARLFSSQTSPRQSSLASAPVSAVENYSSESPIISERITPPMPRTSPLAILPTSSIVRSLAITSISSSPVLLTPSLKIMSLLAHSKSAFLSPDTNPLLRFFLKHTFYKQFCAGENEQEVRHTVNSLKSIGYSGVVLGYAREVVMDDTQASGLESCGEYEKVEARIRNEITPWAKGTRETVELAGPEDFVALKFTGAGSQALYDLSKNLDPSPALKEAIDSICDLAVKRGVLLLFDAEQQAVQTGIDSWTMTYMEKYNTMNKAVIYNTYQAYLKATPSILASHLAEAQRKGFTLGVKLVRGAYLGSDPRHLIHDTKADTDAAYNSIAESLALRTYGSILAPSEAGLPFPPVAVVLAGHNHTSVRKIQNLRTAQAQAGEKQTDLVYAQLQGMADEVSCELVQCGNNAECEKMKVDIPKAYKYLVWGTTGECMKYLLRRAQENKDAVQRTREGRDAMAKELWRRFKLVLGFSG